MPELKNFVRAVFDKLDLVVWAVAKDGTILMSEGRGLRALGLEPGQIVGANAFELYRELPDVLAYIRRALKGEEFVATNTTPRRVVENYYVPIRDENGDITAVAGFSVDISERKRQEEVIRAQALAIAELSTPLIPITDEILVMPLIGAMDSSRAEQVMESLLKGLSSSRGTFAIIDITGVPVVNTHVANALIRAAHAARLLGAEVILTGVRPEVAQTLVTIDADLGSVTTRGTLQSGIAYALDSDPSPLRSRA